MYFDFWAAHFSWNQPYKYFNKAVAEQEKPDIVNLEKKDSSLDLNHHFNYIPPQLNWKFKFWQLAVTELCPESRRFINVFKKPSKEIN